MKKEIRKALDTMYAEVMQSTAAQAFAEKHPKHKLEMSLTVCLHDPEHTCSITTEYPGYILQSE
jgi:hypothetical protein